MPEQGICAGLAYRFGKRWGGRPHGIRRAKVAVSSRNEGGVHGEGYAPHRSEKLPLSDFFCVCPFTARCPVNHFDNIFVKTFDEPIYFAISFVERNVMHIRELASLTGLPERQIRYLIAEGFMPPPRGGRAHADYGDDHVEATRRYTRLKALGFPPAAIKALLSAKEGVPFPIGDGRVTLLVSPDLLGSGDDPNPYLNQLRDLLADLLKESPHAP